MEFTADECQALLDLIDKVGNYHDCEYYGDFTDEEIRVYKKLEDAGKFYNPLKEAKK